MIGKAHVNTNVKLEEHMLKIKRLTKKYRNSHGIFDINLECFASEVCGIIGDNGSGKSTFLKSLAQINAIDLGEITFNGLDIKLQDIGFLPENKAIIEELTAKEYIRLMAKMKHIEDKVWETTCEEHCAWLDAQQLLPQKIKTLSKGNKQKVQILAACIHEPNIVLLDEPFSGLDESNRKNVKNFILKLKSKNKIVIITSHKIDDIEDVADSLCWIHQGKLSIKKSIQLLKSESSIIEVSVSSDMHQEYKEEKGVINTQREGNISVYTFDQTTFAHQFVRMMLKKRETQTITIRNQVVNV